MIERKEEGRPDKLTVEFKGNQKQGETETLVDSLNKYITREEKRFGEYYTREQIIRMNLEHEEE